MQKLLQKRENGNRSFDMETMTSEQLLEEKIAVQKALLFLESVHGRPQAKEDRDIVRPFYDRYRILKRMVAKVSVVSNNIIRFNCTNNNFVYLSPERLEN